jgi:GNAT superfamily N-acetyltransferase
MALSEPVLATESPLTAADLPTAEALVAEAGWNQIAADWRIFLECGTVYAVRSSAGRVIATAATLPYGSRFAWISMVLVASEYRRQGIARRLLQRCIDDDMAAGLVPILDATPAGRTVYRGLGFNDTWTFTRLISRQAGRGIDAVAPPGVAITSINDATWQELCAYDAAVFGADRTPVLTSLRGRLPAAARVAMRAGRIVGFILGRDGRTASQIGPLVADENAVAHALLAQALTAVNGPLYLDVADAKRDVQARLDAIGFTAERPFTRMVHGRTTGFDDPTRTYAVVGPEFG